MLVTMLKSKIHRATVTEAQLHYVGSLTVDANLLDQAGMHEYEKVQVVNINNGNRLETYLIAGPRGSGVICLNGAAARKGQAGDKIIIIAYGLLSVEDLKRHKPRIVFVDGRNRPCQVAEAIAHDAMAEAL